MYIWHEAPASWCNNSKISHCNQVIKYTVLKYPCNKTCRRNEPVTCKNTIGKHQSKTRCQQQSGTIQYAVLLRAGLPIQYAVPLKAELPIRRHKNTIQYGSKC